jgi:hypothetical protein
MELMNIFKMLHTYGLTWSGINWVVLIVILTSIQIAPIRINPWSFILRCVRRLWREINSDIYNEMKDMNLKVDNLSDELTSHILESREETVRKWRSDIMDFCNSEINGRPHTKEQYEEVISSCDKYQKYCEKNNIPNGVAEDSIKEIHRSYRELLATDGFLKTKC